MPNEASCLKPKERSMDENAPLAGDLDSSQFLELSDRISPLVAGNQADLKPVLHMDETPSCPSNTRPLPEGNIVGAR
jgi:hypothetical protein